MPSASAIDESFDGFLAHYMRYLGVPTHCGGANEQNDDDETTNKTDDDAAKFNANLITPLASLFGAPSPSPPPLCRGQRFATPLSVEPIFAFIAHMTGCDLRQRHCAELHQHLHYLSNATINGGGAGSDVRPLKWEVKTKKLSGGAGDKKPEEANEATEAVVISVHFETAIDAAGNDAGDGGVDKAAAKPPRDDDVGHNTRSATRRSRIRAKKWMHTSKTIVHVHIEVGARAWGLSFTIGHWAFWRRGKGRALCVSFLDLFFV